MSGVLKKALKWVGIIAGVIVVILIIAAIAIPHFLPLDKIKDMAAQKASETIHRNVKIGKVSFNIFTGIELSDLSVSNRPGFSSEPFLSAGKIELKYDLWKLLGGTVVIDKVVLVKPEILVQMRADGTSNYSDLIGIKKPAAPKGPATKKKEAVSIMVSKFAVVGGKLTLDQSGKVSQLKDLNVNVSGISLVTKKPIQVSVSVLGLYEGKPVPISVSGSIMLDMNKSSAKISGLDMTAAGEKISVNADISAFDTAPKIALNISSKRIDTDKFLAIVSGAGAKKPKVKPKPAPYGQQTAKINKTLKSIPSNLTLDANIELQNILFKEMKLDSASIKATLSNKVLNLDLRELKAYKGSVKASITADLNVSGVGYSVNNLSAQGFDATIASNDVIESFLTNLPDYGDLKNKLHGTLGFSAIIAGRGVETLDITANARGKGSFLLANGKVSKLKSLSAVGEKLGLKTIQEDIEIKEFKSNFSIADKVVTISKLDLNNGEKGDIKLAFDGSVNIGSMAFISGNRLSLKLNPVTNKLSSEYDAFKDAKGWYSLDFEMTGSLKRPIPIPRLEKSVQQIIDNQKKAAEGAAQKEIDKQKTEIEQKAKQELEKRKKEAEEKAKQELEQKAKEIFKF
ncbi:MAG: AsmA family protein [bacterium]